MSFWAIWYHSVRKRSSLFSSFLSPLLSSKYNDFENAYMWWQQETHLQKTGCPWWWCLWKDFAFKCLYKRLLSSGEWSTSFSTSLHYLAISFLNLFTYLIPIIVIRTNCIWKLCTRIDNWRSRNRIITLGYCRYTICILITPLGSRQDNGKEK